VETAIISWPSTRLVSMQRLLRLAGSPHFREGFPQLDLRAIARIGPVGNRQQSAVVRRTKERGLSFAEGKALIQPSE